jgi:hypothetical protein
MRNMLAVVSIIAAAIAVSGCGQSMGLVVTSSRACDLDRLPTKGELLHDRGEPDEVTVTEETEEVWIYYVSRNQWCGVTPAWLVPIPLLVPACDEYDRFNFLGDEAKKAEAIRVAKTGGMIRSHPFNPPYQPPGYDGKFKKEAGHRC